MVAALMVDAVVDGSTRGRGENGLLPSVARCSHPPAARCVQQLRGGGLGGDSEMPTPDSMKPRKKTKFKKRRHVQLYHVWNILN